MAGTAGLIAREAGQFIPYKPSGWCRWELASVSGHDPSPVEAQRAPVTMLLDQCTGRSWILTRGQGSEFEWLELDRPGLRFPSGVRPGVRIPGWAGGDARRVRRLARGGDLEAAL